MKVSLRILAIFSMVLLVNTQVQARGNNNYQEQYHVGLMAGNIDGGAEYGKVAATGFVIAARNSKASLEYFNMGSKQGDELTTGNQWEANLSGFYLSLIGQGQPYMKFKVGKVKQEMISTGASITTETTSVTSYGLGFGYKLGDRAMIEFDVTTLDKDMTLFSIAVLF